MPSVIASQTFVGTPEELEKYGGQVPKELKDREKKMSEAERNSFKGKITAGTKMEVTDARKKQLEEAGLIEGSEAKRKQGEKINLKGTPEKKAKVTEVKKAKRK